MGNLGEKQEQLDRAIAAWREALDAPFSELNRDATIQRYELTIELLWKTVKLYLKEVESIECFSPKSCFREMRQILQLSDNVVETCLKMIEDRNLSVHTYSEEMSNILYRRLEAYWKAGKIVAEKIRKTK